jgi:hypothetical protein
LLIGGQAGHGLLRGVHAEELVAGCVRVRASSRAAGGRVSGSSYGLARCVRGERSLGNEPAAERGIGFKDRARCEARAARGRGKRESRSHTWTAGIQPPVWRGGCCCVCVCSSYATRDRLCSITAPRRAPCRSPRANKAMSTKECREHIKHYACAARVRRKSRSLALSL